MSRLRNALLIVLSLASLAALIQAVRTEGWGGSGRTLADPRIARSAEDLVRLLELEPQFRWMGEYHMESRGELQLVQTGFRVKILSRRKTAQHRLIEIEIAEGPYRGIRGWVSSDWLE